MTVDEAVLQRLAALGSATVHEAAQRVPVLDPAVRPLIKTSIAGVAVTARCAPGDNLAVHRAVADAPPGAVIVVSANGVPAGYWGEILTVAAQARGVIGVVMDGGVRDTAALARRAFPAWTRHVSVIGTVKRSPGEINVDVRIGEAIIRPGDVIVADEDGAIAIPASDAAEIARLGEERVAMEADLMRRIEEGASTMDLLHLRELA